MVASAVLPAVELSVVVAAQVLGLAQVEQFVQAALGQLVVAALGLLAVSVLQVAQAFALIAEASPSAVEASA